MLRTHFLTHILTHSNNNNEPWHPYWDFSVKNGHEFMVNGGVWIHFCVGSLIELFKGSKVPFAWCCFW